jgi:transcriptional regulator with XRE-family HTH domain
MQKTQIDPDKTYRNKNWLYEMYVEKGLKQEDIADKANCGQHTISRWLRKYGIDTRDASDYNIHPYVGYHPKGYIEAHCQANGNSDRFYLHRLLAVAEYGFNAVKGMDVHHKNGIGWDNRPENIELISPSDHYSMERKKELENGVDLEARLP